MTPQEEDDKSEVNDKPDPNDYIERGNTISWSMIHPDIWIYKTFTTIIMHDTAVPFSLILRLEPSDCKIMEPVTFTPDPKGGIRNLPNERHYLDMNLSTTCHTSFRLLSSHVLRAMVARFLIGSSGRNVESENRLLRDLHSAPSQTVGREYHVQTQAMEHGRELFLFKFHEWKQRAVAAWALGMTPEFHLLTGLSMALDIPSSAKV